MKKVFAIIICVLIVLGIAVACTPKEEKEETSQIVGTWVGKSENNSAKYYYDRYFWAEIKKSEDKVKPFEITIYEVQANKNKKLPGGMLYFNNVQKIYIYDGADISQWSDTGRDYFNYTVTIVNKDEIIFTGEEIDKSNLRLPVTSTYKFERSNLTLEEYEKEVKNKA